MSLFKKLANYSRQYNSTPQTSKSNTTNVRKVCSNCLWLGSFDGVTGSYKCHKHGYGFTLDEVKYNNVLNKHTCDYWRQK